MIITRPPEQAQSQQPEILQKVHTVGYRQKNGHAEIRRIMSSDTACILVDIRFQPQSNNPVWTQQAFIQEYGKRYKWIRDLGNELHKERGKIKIHNPVAGIEQLLLLLQHHSIILMCGCEQYEQCHRKPVYELLAGALAAQEAEHSTPEITATRLLPNRGPANLYPAGSLQERLFNELIEELHTEQADNHQYRELIAELVQYTLENGLADDQEEIYEIIRERLRDGRNEHSQATQKISSRGKPEDYRSKQSANDQKRTYHSSAETYYSTGGDNQDTQEREQRNVRRPAYIQEHDRRSGVQYQGTSGKDNTVREIPTDTAEAFERAERKLEQARRIIKRLLPYRTQARHQEKRIQTFILEHARLRQKHQTIGGLTIPELRDFLRIPSKQLGLTQKIALLFIQEHFNSGIEYGQPQPYDDNGLRRMNCGAIGAQFGVDASTISRIFDFMEKQLPEHFSIDRHNESVVGVKKPVPRVYCKEKDPTILRHSKDLLPLEARKHGGDRYAGLMCQRCESDHYEVIRKTKTTDVFHCLDCDHRALIEESEKEKTIYTQAGTGGNTPEKNKKQHAFYSEDDPTQEKAPGLNGNLQVVITSNPPLAASEHHPENNQLAAARLLLAIAGQHEKHIVMPRRAQESKYIEVKRTLTIEDVTGHLRGGEARGAPCSYENDETVCLCWDADELDPWMILQQAARLLVVAGYLPLLEESPADRGGHLWIIFEARVNATQAREHVYSIAPDLRRITEFWPAPPDAKKWNRVRLPGGFYNRHETGEEPVKGWCKLVAVASSQECKDGTSNAVLLLANQTPIAVIVATIHNAGPQMGNKEEKAPTRVIEGTATQIDKKQDARQEQTGYRLPEVDAEWLNRYGPVEKTTYWFAVTSSYAAKWYNERHTLEEIQPRERNRKALSPNGNERTASTDYYEVADGERYTDYSQHGKRSDGTRDTGDVLELAAKVQKVPKNVLIGQTTSQISKQAKIELVEAARTGKPLPAWIEEIVTPAGRREYAKLLGKGRNEQRPDQLGERSETIPEQLQHSSVRDNQTNAASRAVTGQELHTGSSTRGAGADYRGIESNDRPANTSNTDTRSRETAASGEDRGAEEHHSTPTAHFESVETQEGINAAPEPEQTPADYPHLRVGMRIETPAGIASITSITQCTIMKKPRCSVRTSTMQKDGTYFKAFDLSEVTPIEQATLL